MLLASIIILLFLVKIENIEVKRSYVLEWILGWREYYKMTSEGKIKLLAVIYTFLEGVYVLIY